MGNGPGKNLMNSGADLDKCFDTGNIPNNCDFFFFDIFINFSVNNTWNLLGGKGVCSRFL